MAATALSQEEVKRLGNEMLSLWPMLKDKVEAMEPQVAKFGAAEQELKNTRDDINKRMSAIETILSRPALAGLNEGYTEGANGNNVIQFPGKKAPVIISAKTRQGLDDLYQYIRRSPIDGDAIPADLKARLEAGKKALSLSDETLGGYFAPPEYSQELIKNFIQYSPIRQIARVRTTMQRSVRFPKRTGVFAAQWVAEQGSRSETTGLTYGMDEIPTHELYALVDISLQDLEDNMFNMEEQLNMEFIEQFGVAEGLAFVSGSGVGKPEGLLTNTSVSYTASGNASLLQADAFATGVMALKPVYRRNLTWVMNASTIQTIRTLKDGNGQYLWQFSVMGPDAFLQGGFPLLILGRPYMEAVDMPNIGANTYPIIFGDFEKAYYIVDRIQMAVQRDPFTQATSGNVRYIARRRLGGAVVLPESVRKIKIAVS